MAFTNGSTSTQKVKVLSTARTGQGTKLDKFGITYTRTDGGGNGTPLTASKFTSDYSAEEKALLKAAAEGKDNGEIVLIKEFSQRPGQDKGFWNLKTIKPATTAIETSKSNYSGSQKSSQKGGYNEAGIKVGAVLHDAATIATTQKGNKVTVADVESVARELLAISVKLEEEVRNGVYNSPLQSSTSTKSSKVTAESKPSQELNFDSIDNIEIEDDFNLDLDL